MRSRDWSSDGCSSDLRVLGWQASSEASGFPAAQMYAVVLAGLVPAEAHSAGSPVRDRTGRPDRGRIYAARPELAASDSREEDSGWHSPFPGNHAAETFETRRRYRVWRTRVFQMSDTAVAPWSSSMP